MAVSAGSSGRSTNKIVSTSAVSRAEKVLISKLVANINETVSEGVVS